MIADNHIIIIGKMEKANEFLPELCDYRKLRVFQVTTIIYDITRYFANNVFIAGDRTIDQMVQAARSGRQNIAEGSAAATTSKETEIKLTNVAKASLQELLLDYEDYLRQHGLQQWPKDDRRTLQTRQYCRTHNDPRSYVEAIKKRSPETAANIAIVLIHQADYMLERLLAHQKKRFLEEGGIREAMYRARRAHRGY